MPQWQNSPAWTLWCLYFVPLANNDARHRVGRDPIQPSLDVHGFPFLLAILHQQFRHVQNLLGTNFSLGRMALRREELGVEEPPQATPVGQVGSDGERSVILVAVVPHGPGQPLGPGAEAGVVAFVKLLGNGNRGNHDAGLGPWYIVKLEFSSGLILLKTCQSDLDS